MREVPRRAAAEPREHPERFSGLLPHRALPDRAQQGHVRWVHSHRHASVCFLLGAAELHCHNYAGHNWKR